jgi:hypothetical protein
MMIATDQPVPLRAALRYDLIRRAIKIDGCVSIADLKTDVAFLGCNGLAIKVVRPNAK